MKVFIQRTLWHFSLLSLTGSISLSLATEVKTKYGTLATPLSQSYEYVKTHPSPDFWALIPYYVAQQTEGTCSVASVAMVVNAARVSLNLKAEDELATESGLLKRVKKSAWEKMANGYGRGVTLDELGPILVESFKSYGVEPVEVEIFHIKDSSPETLKKLDQQLSENEKSKNTLIVANFLQGVYTGDTDVGHIAPVGAYDASNKKVLILDPDRKWYEPYWVSLATFAKGMATQDSQSKNHRGFIRIKLPARQST